MAEQSKAELIAELERARSRVSSSLGGIAHRLDLHARLKESVGKNKTLWFSGAAAAGWILARLPARRKKARAIANGSEAEKPGAHRGAGMLLPFLKLGLAMLRPTITAFATKKITDLARGHRDDGSTTDTRHV